MSLPPIRALDALAAIGLLAASFSPRAPEPETPPPEPFPASEAAETTPAPLPSRAEGLAAGALDDGPEPATLEEQRRNLLSTMRRELGLTAAQVASVEAIVSASTVLGQGNPALSQHPMSRSECRRIRGAAGLVDAHEPACGAPHMVPLFDPGSGQTAADAPVCIDQFEFPGLPCEYPVVNVRAREAALLCRAIGKRICDAHEWEGACAGSLHDPSEEYEWARDREGAAWFHNYKREQVWSYGPQKNHALCATGSFKTPGCVGGFAHCGSNTYPAGAFPACVSPFGVFDLHGNVAEHMNLPILPGDLARNEEAGYTEMKGSWFAFGTMEAHRDDCRWRAPDWHATRLMSESSHWNYHLGFRCCADVERP
jgi:sulfatase modifying factor 1